MKVKRTFKATRIKNLIVPIIITIVMLGIIETFMIISVKNHYHKHVQEDTLSLAYNYSHSLTKVTEAKEILNQLIDEKLLVASKTVTLYEGEYSNELLGQMADNLIVDVIYYYNSQGQIIYSNDGTYIGWKAYEGHPVYNFMISGNQSLVEVIRKDSESEKYYKYGYFKGFNGEFVQIGVLADKIQNFLDEFELQRLIDELIDNGMTKKISFIDNNFNIIVSTDEQLIGKKITNQEAKEAIIANREYGFEGVLYGEKIYEVYLPMYFNGYRIGAVNIAQSLKTTQELIKRINFVNIISLLIMFISVLYIIISIYNKNKQLFKLAYYDSLTSLPNREYFINYLTDMTQEKKGNKKAILLINFSNFRTINLTSGYQYGDKILKEIAYRIKKSADTYKLFRFTADRFIIYVDNYNHQGDLIKLSNKISEEFKVPLDGCNYVEIQIGIAELNNKYYKTDQILKNVSIAVSQIKNNDKNYAFFNEEMEKQLERENTIEVELRNALSENDTKKIYLEYHPQVDIKTNQIVGFEALARMRTDNLGLISPEEFVNVAERKNIIVPLGNLILNNACRFLERLKKLGFNDTKVGVNISGIQLLRDEFIETVINIMKENEIMGSNLELEITESILLNNYELINEKLKELRNQNIKIALDDFGTGYSSFSRLRELNIDFVKIDRYFISRIIDKKHNEFITGDIISMSHKIGLGVVAEGVETETQRKYLIDNNCDIMQGYLFSRPLSEEVAIQILKSNKYFGIENGGR